MSNKHPASYIGASKAVRDGVDFYPTPYNAIRALFKEVTFPGMIWEPACGDGRIATIAEENGYDVVASDLYNHGYGTSGVDFFSVEVPKGCKSLVTNPPYQIKHDKYGKLTVEDWIAVAWDKPEIQKMAVLLKTTAIAGQRRSKIIEASNLAWMLQFRGRISMFKNGVKAKGNNMIDFAWFIFERGYMGYPRIKYIEPIGE